MNKHLIWAWALKNCIAIFAWVVLAMAFDKWWIALFGILFMSDYQED